MYYKGLYCAAMLEDYEQNKTLLIFSLEKKKYYVLYAEDTASSLYKWNFVYTKIHLGSTATFLLLSFSVRMH